MAMGEPTVVRGPCESTVVCSALRHAVASPPRECGPAGGECAHGFDTVSTRAVCFTASTLQRHPKYAKATDVIMADPYYFGEQM